MPLWYKEGVMMTNPWNRKKTEKDNPIVELEEKTETPKVEVEGFVEGQPWYKSNVVSSEYNPKDSLLTHISGSKWICTYYQHIRDDDEGLDSHSTSNGIYQQIRKIENFELRIDSPISPTQNDNSEMSASGSARIYTSLIPSEGESFIADIVDGRLALFSVTSVKRATLAKNTSYTIEYSLISIITDDSQIEELEKKVIQTFVFNKDYLKHGLSPFLTKEETHNRKKLKCQMRELEDEYLSEFYNFNLNTIILAVNTTEGYKYLYDPYMLNYVKNVFERNTRDIRTHLVSGGSDQSKFNRDTLWDLLFERRNSRRSTMVMKATYRSTKSKYSQPNLNLLHWSEIDYYCLGSSDIEGVDISESEVNTQMGVSSTPGFWALGYLPQTIPTEYDVGVPVSDIVGEYDNEVPAVPTIYPNNSHLYYVFSKYWYLKEKDNYSTLESAVDDYLSKESVDLNKLAVVIDDIENWSKLDRFYFIPIVYSLLKVGLVGC